MSDYIFIIGTASAIVFFVLLVVWACSSRHPSLAKHCPRSKRLKARCAGRGATIRRLAEENTRLHRVLDYLALKKTPDLERRLDAAIGHAEDRDQAFYKLSATVARAQKVLVAYRLDPQPGRPRPDFADYVQALARRSDFYAAKHAELADAVVDASLAVDPVKKEVQWSKQLRDDLIWLYHQATKNLHTWGLQDAETLVLAATEELGEVAKALLEYRQGEGEASKVRLEAIDLGAVCLQIMLLAALGINNNETDRGVDPGSYTVTCGSDKIERIGT